MLVYEVFLNGKRSCAAGIDGDGVLTAIMDHVKVNARDELRLTVGGLITATREHVTWTKTNLTVGDEVQVRILESTSADEPSTRMGLDPEHELEQQRDYVRNMAKRLGWTLIEPSSSA